jgi:signal transduction histidine kinase
MQSLRWWHAAVWGTAVVLSALLFVEGLTVTRIVGAAVCVVLLAILWSTLGPRGLRDARVGIPLVVAVVILSGLATGFSSSMATIQCIAYPLVWTVLDRRRDAVIGNISLTVSVGVGLYIGNGGSASALALAAIIEGLSLVFSLSLGLWITAIAEQSEERRRLLDALEAAQSKLAILSRDAGAASEREHLAREIHDTIAQDLAGFVLTAQRGMRELRAGDTNAVETQLQILEENARNALVETRALVASGAAVGADGGLATALRRLGERFERETGIAVTVSADDAAALDRDAEVVLLRCAQEALANVRKHSAAATASLTLVARGEEIELQIADDGRGFDPFTYSHGFGLDGMRERLAFVHGSLTVTTSAGGGTTLVASLPAAREVTA